MNNINELTRNEKNDGQFKTDRMAKTPDWSEVREGARFLPPDLEQIHYRANVVMPVL